MIAGLYRANSQTAEKTSTVHHPPFTQPPAFLPGPRAAPYLFALALGLSFLLGPLDEVGWQKNALGRIPPGREASIGKWLDLLRGEGFSYEDAQIGREHIAFTGKGDAAPCALRFSRRGAAPTAPHTPSFAVQAFLGAGAAQSTEKCQQTARQAAKVIAPHDNGTFFSRRPGERIPVRVQVDQKGPTPGFIIRPMLETLAWLALLLLLWGLAQGILGILRPAQIQGRWCRGRWILLATLCAVGLRVWLPPAGPVHANEHGILELLSYTPAAIAPGHSMPVGLYGYGGYFLFRVLATVSGLSGTALLLLAGVILGFCTPLVACGLRAMGCGAFAVHLGTFGYALTPILLRASPIESPLMMAACLALLGYLLIFHSLEQNRICFSWLLLGAGIIILAVQVHLITLSWVMPAFALPFVAPRGRKSAALIATSLIVLCTAPHALYIVDTFLLHGVRVINPGLRFVEQIGQPTLAILNPFLVPFAWLPLGIVALCTLPPPARWLAWLTFVPLLLLSVSVSQNFSDVLRYQAPLALFLLLLSSWGVEHLVASAESMVERRAYGWALALCILGTGSLSLPVSWVGDPESEVARIVEEAAAEGLLDQGLHTPVPSSDSIKQRPTALPSWALPASAPRDNPNAPYVLIGTRCVHRPSEKSGEYPPLDPGCAKAVQRPLEALRIARTVPDEFAGLPVWFMPRRTGAPTPGIYRAR